VSKKINSVTLNSLSGQAISIVIDKEIKQLISSSASPMEERKQEMK
jgi:hypothetical protein